MTILLTVAGGILGAFALEWGGFLLGLLGGYALARAVKLGGELEGLQRRIDALEKTLRKTLEEPAVARPQAAEAQPAPAPAAVKPEPAPATVEASIQPVLEQRARPAPAPQAAPSPKAPAQRVPAAALPGPVPPRAPDFGQRLFNAVRDWFTSGNVVVKVGVIILFFGVAFLVRYVAERVEVPIELRLMGIALGAVAMLIVGWRLREKRPDYALVIQGGAVGVLFLTIFAAFRLYHLLPGVVAFALLAAVSALTAVLAVLQESRSLAIFGVSGGFLAPILASTGGGSHVMLFSYYAMINAGILAIAWHRAWRALNVVGWAFTFAIGALWGSQYYRPEHFATTEPFLILFFLFYVAIAVLFTSRQPPNLKGLVDGTVVFGTPLIAFGMQSWLVRGMEFGAAISAATAGSFYILLARWLFGRERDRYRLLAEAFLALGVVFITLAIPLAVDGRWTAATWALEGAGIFWIGLRQQRLAARVFGLGLQLAAGLAYFSEAMRGAGAVPVLNSAFIGALMISAAGWISAWLMHRAPAEPKRAEGELMWPAAIWAIAWWYGAGLQEIRWHVAAQYIPAASLGFVTASSLAFAMIDRRLDWWPLKTGALVLLLSLVASFAGWAISKSHPASDFGWAAWPAAFAASYYALARFDADLAATLRAAAHFGTALILIVLASWEVSWQVGRFVEHEGTWAAVSWALVPVAALATLGRGKGPDWPVRRHIEVYAGGLPALLAAGLLAWTLYVNFTRNGSAAPLPYLPLLNPLDVMVAAVFLALSGWLAFAKRERALAPVAGMEWKTLYALLGVPAFVWMNGIVLRSLHHYAGVPFDLEAMLRSTLVQAAFSLLWTVSALALMYFATRRSLRPLWLTGAALLAVVVGKLFTVDIAHVGGLHRIVSFIGVALLMLVIGYVSPLPPRSQEEEP